MTMFRLLPPFGQDPRGVAEVVNGIMNGKTNNTGTVTLATGNALTTTLVDERISIDTKIILIPFSDAAENDSAPYGQFSNNDDQVAPSAGSSAVINWDTTEFSNGVYIDDLNKIYVRNYGIYNVQFSVQLANIGNTQEYADIWFRKNTTDVERSASRFELKERKSEGVPTHLIGTVNCFIELDAGDYVQIAGAVSSVNVTLEHYAADATIPRPAIPAAILTVNYVAPQAYSNIYVSSQQSGQATISHFANNTADKTYAYILIG
jgi:hypothetical protein